MTIEASERVGEGQPADALVSATPEDVPALLSAYREAQALARHPPPSLALPTAGPVTRIIRAFHLRTRPTWFAERWMALELRRRCEVLERGISEQLAIGGEPTAEETRDRAALGRFRESLLPPLSGFVAVALFVSYIVLAQAIGNGLLVYHYSEVQTNLVRSLDAISLTPDVSSINALVRALGHADLTLLWAFVMGLLASGYLIGRGPASGYRMARLALGEPDGLGVPRRASTLSRSAASLRLREVETAVFAAVDRDRPRQFPFDLAVKALLAMGWVYVAIFSLRDKADPGDYSEFRIFALLAGLRLLWLARASVVRGAGFAWLAVPVAALVAGAMIAAPERFEETPNEDAAVDPALALQLSSRPELIGIDLRGRKLTRFYLRGKNLTLANLRGATLDEADLRDAVLRSADLSDASLPAADLRRADLTHALLTRARLSSADLSQADLRDTNLRRANVDRTLLCGADLRGADLARTGGRPFYDERTRWPRGFKPPRQHPNYIGCSR